MKSENSLKWCETMEEELRSMSSNDVWDLVEISSGAKRVGCKWVYKTKYDFTGKIKRFKTRLVAKGFTQREEIDYTETFLLKERRLIIQKPSRMSPKRIHLES
jgi:hypothetical protein